LTSGKVIDHTFNAGVKVKTARIERRPHQFLYKDEMGFHFMHMETYEQLSLQSDMIENYDLMKDGQHIDIIVHEDTETPLFCELPAFVELVVTYTEPGLKGDTTSSSSNKRATVETDAEIFVPLFINIDDKIKIDTRTRSYSERVKS